MKVLLPSLTESENVIDVPSLRIIVQTNAKPATLDVYLDWKVLVQLMVL